MDWQVDSALLPFQRQISFQLNPTTTEIGKNTVRERDIKIECFLVSQAAALVGLPRCMLPALSSMRASFNIPKVN